MSRGYTRILAVQIVGRVPLGDACRATWKRAEGLLNVSLLKHRMNSKGNHKSQPTMPLQNILPEWLGFVRICVRRSHTRVHNQLLRYQAAVHEQRELMFDSQLLTIQPVSKGTRE